MRNDGSQRTGQVVPIRYNKRLDIMLLEAFDFLMDNCGLSVTYTLTGNQVLSVIFMDKN